MCTLVSWDCLSSVDCMWRREEDSMLSLSFGLRYRTVYSLPDR